MISRQGFLSKIISGRKIYIFSSLLFMTFSAFTQSPGEIPKTMVSGEAVKDADNNLYIIVKLGDQIWMAENLKTTKYKDGTAIPFVTGNKAWSEMTTPGYCWYNNNEGSNRYKHGALYNWYTVNTGNLCPDGWHVPKDEDWAILEKYLNASGYDFEGIINGNKLGKSFASAYGWISSKNTGAVGNTDYSGKRNSTGFTALPGGYRYNNGVFHGDGSHCCWWYSKEYDTESAWGRNLLYFYDSVHKGISSKKNGFSVRCLKD